MDRLAGAQRSDQPRFKGGADSISSVDECGDSNDSRGQRAAVERLMAISRRSAARSEPFLDDADLYDDMGLPGDGDNSSR